ncbi:response regulator [Pseudomonas sp. JS3066]|uniref:response regulator n=1 Tax=unclassified Pseudomonas TaxID=196821 RepID=UPI000EAA0B33|nr:MULTISPECIES: response regulator [unclassified Pseudomonas]AYF90209.1 response regulator [Pseudomonas sp. DY-1]MDH4652449.1 response regulator [Pseudomonas sp. BN606]MRK20781.1 response regulator [Pseudomonas sp. JG-B]WVK92219.1 response regulator [Pseudomonas sp. JS3066]
MDDNQSPFSRKYLLPLLVTLTLLLVLGGLVIWQWLALEARNRDEYEQRFKIEAEEIAQRVGIRMRAYEMVLRGMSGLMVGSTAVSAEEWARATDQLQLQDRYPGIQALAWARYLKHEELSEFVGEIWDQGRREFRVFPSEPRDEYLVVQYSSPMDWRNRRTLGFDMLTEAVRREAINLAWETGEAILTGPVKLRQETDQQVQGGLLLYMPVYRPDAPSSTVEERRAALIGMVCGAFRVSDLMDGILGTQSSLYKIDLKDLGNPGLPLLETVGGERQPRFHQVQELKLFGRTWALGVGSTAKYEAMLGNNRIAFSLWTGLAAAVLLSLLVGGYLYQRERQLQLSLSSSIELAEREERFRLLLQHLPVATLICDVQGRIEMANASAGDLLACDTEFLLGQRLQRYLPNMAALVSSEADQAPTQLTEVEVQQEGGERIPVALTLSSLNLGVNHRYLINLVDLQARKSAEERFRLVVEASPNAIVLVDTQGRIAMVNRQAEQLFGYSRQEMLDAPVEKLLPEALRESHVAMREGFLRKPEQRRMGSNRELFGQHRDGTMIPLEVGLSPIRAGREVLVQAVIIDITERRAAEQRLRDQAEQLMLANRYKSEFLANMSHELRTPLNSILILSDQLRQNMVGNLTEKQTRHADIVHRAGSDLLQLINDVLDLAKVEAGRMQLKLEPLNVQDMLAELDGSLRPMAEIKGLRLSTHIQAGVPRVIHSDRVRLHQILRNLLSNALKFTEQGEVELSVELDPSAATDEREVLRFAVRDTGIGIPEDQHDRIFQAFQQIDGSTSRRFGGTGLGLAITRQLVLALDGDITLESVPGRGSRFIVRLPVAVAASQPKDDETPPQPVRSGQGPSVLIVEDDVNFASVMAEEAQAHGFSSVHCRSGKQAIALLQSERFAAVILDILLPDISGWQIYRRLRSHANHRATPVNIISCVPQPQDWNEDDTRYLVKPIAREDLEQVFHDLEGGTPPDARKLLLVEDVDVEREHYREHLEQLGFNVVASASGEGARKAYAQNDFSALVIDLDLPDQDGFELLDSLDRERPLDGSRVVINTGVDVNQQNLQRLRRYSAVVVRKAGEDLDNLSSAVQGFLAAVRQPNALSDMDPLEGSRVLLVDDDVRNIYALSALLDEAGLKVTAARDGLEAIECFQREPFDLILMDMAMPNMDGYTATRVLKQEHGCAIPIIALTAHAMKGDREKCITAGADDYLAKPVSRQEVLDMLYRWLEQPGGRHGAPAA